MRIFISSREYFKAESAENKARFYRKDGLLNVYAFACGYVETYFYQKRQIILGIKIVKDSCAYMAKGWINGEYIFEAFNTPSKARKYIQGRIAEARKYA